MTCSVGIRQRPPISNKVLASMESFISPPKKRRQTGTHCMAPGCTNYHGKDNSVSHHRFPADNKDLAQQWLHEQNETIKPTQVGEC